MLGEEKRMEIVFNLYVNQKEIGYFTLYPGHDYFYYAIDPQVSAQV